MIYTVTLNPAIDKTVTLQHMVPGRLNRALTSRSDPGGKGINVSKVLAQLGASHMTLGILAGKTGDMLAQSCQELGLKCRFWYCEGETRTNLKLIDQKTLSVTEVNEPGPAGDEEILEQVLRYLLTEADTGDIVVLSGSLPRGTPIDFYAGWIRQLQEKGIKVFLDADGPALIEGLRAGPYLIKPNRDELRQLSGLELEENSELMQFCVRLQEKGVSRIIVSQGEHGALFLMDGIVYQAQALDVPVSSTVGAGDAMVAALAYCEEAGMGGAETIRLAIAASAATVKCSGTQAPSKEEILALADAVRFQTL